MNVTFSEIMLLHGSHYHVKRKIASYTPMKEKCAAIINIILPKLVKECTSFCGVVNILSSFLTDMRKYIILTYDIHERKTNLGGLGNGRKL